MKHALALILLSAAAFVGCDSKLFSDGDDKHKVGVEVWVYSDGDFYGKNAKGDELARPAGITVHSLQDFICLQRLNQARKTVETISSLEKQIKSSADDSPRARELRKEILETRTQLLGILSSIEDAKFIFVP